MIQRHSLQFRTPGGRQRRRSGFTLLELLVSIGILVMVTTVSLASYRSGAKGTIVQLEAQRLVADLRLTQGRALGSFEYSGTVPKGGWGIKYVPGASSYDIVVDVNGTNNPADFVTVQTVALGNGVTFDAGGTNPSRVMFIPPNPVTKLDGVAAGSKDITLTNGTQTRTITVNFLGLIDEN